MASGDPLSRTTDQIRASKNAKKKRKAIAKRKRVKAEKRKRKQNVKKNTALQNSLIDEKEALPLKEEGSAIDSSA